MSTGDVTCPKCKSQTILIYIVSVNSYQCPSCKKFWDGKFPITLTNKAKTWEQKSLEDHLMWERLTRTTVANHLIELDKRIELIEKRIADLQR